MLCSIVHKNNRKKWEAIWLKFLWYEAAFRHIQPWVLEPKRRKAEAYLGCAAKAARSARMVASTWSVAGVAGSSRSSPGSPTTS